MASSASILAHEQRVEGARYALLRRLAFAMRHHVVVHLQPIGMITEVMERRLESAATDVAQIRDGLAKVNLHARAAVQSSLDVVGWLAPEDGELARLDASLRECVGLLRSHLNFRGFTLKDEVLDVPHPVSRAAVRSVLPAALLALADAAPSPADVVIRAGNDQRGILVVIELHPTQGPPGFTGDPHYRLLQWSDVEAIAGAEGVDCTRDGDAVTLAFPS